MTVMIKTEAYQPWTALAEYTEQLTCSAKYGATTCFIGTMRDFNEADQIAAMTLEHYPGMTEKALKKIENNARSQWPLLDTLIIHRVGPIKPDETIVVVAVWSAHRVAAFEASRYMIEALKHTAPFWKKETQVDGGHHWVAKNT